MSMRVICEPIGRYWARRCADVPKKSPDVLNDALEIFRFAVWIKAQGLPHEMQVYCKNVMSYLGHHHYKFNDLNSEYALSESDFASMKEAAKIRREPEVDDDEEDEDNQEEEEGN